MEEEKLTMADLLKMEDERLIREKELEAQRQAEEKERARQEKERRHQEYLEEKERKHQEYLAEKERRANTFEDTKLTCKKCGNQFVWTAAEQKFYKEKGFFRPSMCKECRSKIKTINNFHK